MIETLEWQVALNVLESRLLAAWVAGPSFRQRWTPDPSEFFTLQHRAVAKACAALAKLGPIDLGVQLVSQLASSGDLKLWPLGQSPLQPVTVLDPDADLGKWRELRCLFALRTRLVETLSSLTPSSPLSDARKRVLEAASKASISALAQTWTDQGMMRLAVDAVTRRNGLSSFCGHKEIDRATGGIRPREIWVLGAPTNWGKSSWLLSVADHYLTVHGRGVLYISCEDDAELLSTRMLCRRGSIRGLAARAARLSARELDSAVEVLRQSRDGAPVLLDGIGRPVSNLVEDIREWVAGNGPGLVLVDYLQCVTPVERNPDRRQEINQIYGALSDAVKTLGCSGIFASQITAEELRESKDVENRSTVTLIGRAAENGELSLWVKKNKCGIKHFSAEMAWDPITGSFTTELETEDEYSRIFDNG